MKAQSTRQRQRERKLAQLKKVRLLGQVDDKGYCWCEQCGMVFTRLHADDVLELHHKVERSQEFNDQPENLILLCSLCHQSEHRRSKKVDGLPVIVGREP